MEFQDWITRKYVDWRGDKIGREGTVSAFARWVGVTQSTMAYWMSGNNTPDSAVSINALIGRFGGEVYDVLDITPVVETEDVQALQQLAEILKDVPRERHNDLVFAVRTWAELNGYIISENKKGGSSNEE